VGAEYRAPATEITSEAIAAYADATGDPLPAYRAGAASIAPPVFAIVPAWAAVVAALSDRSLGIDVGRVVHGEQRMRFHRPIRAGDLLGTVGRLASVEERGPNEVFVVALSTSDARGQPVCEQEVVAVSRGTAAGGGRSEVQGRAGPSGRSAPAEVPPPDAERAVELAPDIASRYAEASGDRNRIHLDDAFARSVGLPGVIVHGMCLLAVACQLVVEEAAGADPARLRSVQVRFARPIRPGTTLTTGLWRTPDGARFESVGPDGKAVLRDGRSEIV
jgi:acyl dehydratase